MAQWWHKLTKTYSKKLVAVNCGRLETPDFAIKSKTQQTFICWVIVPPWSCREYDPKTQSLTTNSKFEYLGFTFDGETVYLKSSGISKFYRKMKRTIKRGVFYANYGKNNVPKLFKNRIYKRFSIIGAKRRTIYKKPHPTSTKWIKTNKYEWGNFLSYTELANRVFKNGKIKCKIKSQTRNHWSILHKLMKDGQARINKLHLSKLLLVPEKKDNAADLFSQIDNKQ